MVDYKKLLVFADPETFELLKAEIDRIIWQTGSEFVFYLGFFKSKYEKRIWFF